MTQIKYDNGAAGAVIYLFEYRTERNNTLWQNVPQFAAVYLLDFCEKILV